MEKEGALRVWNVVNPPDEPRYFLVKTPEEGAALIDKLAKRQLENEFISSNAFGLEVFGDGEWCEWYSEEGDDIDSAFEED